MIDSILAHGKAVMVENDRKTLRYTGLKARMENNIMDYFIQSASLTVITKLSFVAVALYDAKSEIAIVFKSVLLFFCALVFGVRASVNCRRDKIIIFSI